MYMSMIYIHILHLHQSIDYLNAHLCMMGQKVAA